MDKEIIVLEEELDMKDLESSVRIYKTHLEDTPEEDKGFSLDLKPEHSKKAVFSGLKAKFKRMKRLPIEYFENQLYGLCYKYSTLISYRDLSIDIINRFHHIWRLKKKEMTLEDEDLKNLNYCLQREVSIWPNILDEYNLISESLDVLSSLVIKWKISSIYNIMHRFQHVATIIQIIDVDEFNTHYFSMETLALSFYVSERPLVDLVSVETKDYGKLLQEAFWSVLTFMLTINKANKAMIPSISGILARKSQGIARLLSATPTNDLQDYQPLEMPGFFQRVLYRQKYKRITDFKKLLTEFDLAYRIFEVSIFNCFLEINHFKYN